MRALGAATSRYQLLLVPRGRALRIRFRDVESAELFTK